MTKAKRKAATATKTAAVSAAAGLGTPGTETLSIRDGRVRAVIDAVLPAVDGGRFPVKCIAGEAVGIEAHCFTDGHDKLRVVLQCAVAGDTKTYEVEMAARVND